MFYITIYSEGDRHAQVVSNRVPRVGEYICQHWALDVDDDYTKISYRYLLVTHVISQLNRESDFAAECIDDAVMIWAEPVDLDTEFPPPKLKGCTRYSK